MSESYIVKARGLPWSATADEVVGFFHDVNVINGASGVHFTFNNDGRPSGECFIEVESKEDVETALSHDNQHMGKRYIEVKEAKQSEMEWVVNRMSSGEQATGSGDGVVRLRGLPYGVTKQEIANFFSGLQIIPYGINITMDQDGKASGDAYVEFATVEDAEKAMEKHKEKIGHRYIEVFRSSKGDIKYVVGAGGRNNDGRGGNFVNQRPSPYDRPTGGRARGRGGMNLGPSGFSSGFNSGYDSGMRRGGKAGPMRGGRSGGMSGGGMGGNKMGTQNSKTGHSVHMRGLPFEATVNDVRSFFAPVNTVDIRLIYEANGRAKGECDVDFATHNDAEMAMQKDKQNMGHRYIELFLKSTMNGGGGNTGWSGGNATPLMGSNRGNNNGGGYGGYNSQDRGMGGNMGGGNMGGGNMNNNTGMQQQQNSGYGGYGGGYNSFNENVSYPNVQSNNHNNFFGQNMR